MQCTCILRTRCSVAPTLLAPHALCVATLPMPCLYSFHISIVCPLRTLGFISGLRCSTVPHGNVLVQVEQGLALDFGKPGVHSDWQTDCVWGWGSKVTLSRVEDFQFTERQHVKFAPIFLGTSLFDELKDGPVKYTISYLLFQNSNSVSRWIFSLCDLPIFFSVQA